ncbi:DUF4262 domain-containing protein [Inquilinus sp. NPDC058860]|uniref:DUF4262 domain-containing protein n=1 Tax=Inquilinus sp. NPDC058860 TaxID=3346652 RepID=UPI003680B1FD
MATALDAPVDALDPQERRFVAIMREHGWHHTGVFEEDENPEFSYSTGFWLTLRHPEIIAFSLSQDVAGRVLWDLYRDLQKGRVLPVGVRLSDVFANTDAYLMPVDKQHYAEHVGWSRWFYGNDDFPCLQLVWPDKRGAFPWEAGRYEPPPALQPDLSPAGWIQSLKS